MNELTRSLIREWDKWEALLAYIRKLEADKKRMEEALEFYADEKHWEQRVETLPCGCCTDFIGFEAENDGGRRARECLKGNGDGLAN